MLQGLWNQCMSPYSLSWNILQVLNNRYEFKRHSILSLEWMNEDTMTCMHIRIQLQIFNSRKHTWRKTLLAIRLFPLQGVLIETIKETHMRGSICWWFHVLSLGTNLWAMSKLHFQCVFLYSFLNFCTTYYGRNECRWSTNYHKHERKKVRNLGAIRMISWAIQCLTWVQQANKIKFYVGFDLTYIHLKMPHNFNTLLKFGLNP